MDTVRLLRLIIDWRRKRLTRRLFALSSQSLSSPTSPTSLPPPPSPTYSTPGSTASPATYEDTLLNPWTRPGTVVNRPMLSAEEASHMGESREANPWKVRTPFLFLIAIIRAARDLN